MNAAQDLNTWSRNQWGQWGLGHNGSCRYKNSICGCVLPVLGVIWWIAHKTDTRKTAVALRDRHKQERSRETVKEAVHWEWNYINKKKTDKQEVKTDKASGGKTGRSGQVHKKAINWRKQTQIGCEKPSKTRPFFPLFGLYFGENKAHFFPEHGETKSIVLPVHTYYFSKAPAGRR